MQHWPNNCTKRHSRLIMLIFSQICFVRIHINVHILANADFYSHLALIASVNLSPGYRFKADLTNDIYPF